MALSYDQKIKIFFATMGLVGSMSLASMFYGFVHLHSAFGRGKINCQSQLEQIVNDEKKKLGCNKPVHAFLVKNPPKKAGRNAHGGAAKYNGKYYIFLMESYAAKNLLKHELYHVCDGHADVIGSDRGIKYNFWAEPQADLYSVFGVKM